MRTTLRSLSAFAALALACAFSASAAYAAPPGNVAHPVNVSQAMAETAKNTHQSAAPALAGELQGFKVTAPFMGVSLGTAMNGRLRSSEGWDGYGATRLNQDTCIVIFEGARIGSGSGDGRLCWRT